MSENQTNEENQQVVEPEPQVQAVVEPAAAPEEEVAVPFADVLQSRAAFYEMLASFFFTPLTQDQIDEMAGQDFSAYEDINDEFSAGLNDIRRYLRKRNTGSRQELACDFTSAFAGTKTYNGLAAVPYESVFTSEDGLLCRESYHEVYAAYKHEALRKREGLNFPEDHLSFMCQFMAILSRRTSQRLTDDDYEGALDDLRVSRDFLHDHILSWYAAFRERALLLVQTRFYRGVLALGAGYFAFDAEVLDDLVAEVESCL
jgi:TorA maturation chaperone TorD